jgi:thioredoxin reductase (NADPH)
MDKTFDVLVAGGGIAGLTAGLTAARLGRATLVLTGDVPGGQLLSIEKVEGYPGYPDGIPGYDLCPMAQDQAVAAGAEVAAGELTGLSPLDGGWLIATGEGNVQARAVILATGTHLKELGVPGEARLRGKGVSHCASCDAPLLRNKIVAVVGGGDSAMQEALTLAAAASKVIILHRGTQLSGQATYRHRVSQQSNIEIRFTTIIEEILGADGVTGVRLEGGAEIEAAGVFVYVGLAPNTAPLNGLLKLDSSGRILTDSEMRTGLPGLYAAGTVRAGAFGRAVAAAGEGTVAALAADRDLGGAHG